MTTARELTLAEVLRSATDRLAAAGATSPRPEAEAIACHVLGCSWSGLWERRPRRLGEADLRALDELVERRAAGEPLAYVLGRATFFGLELCVGPGALVPRPETETVVEVALELIAGRSRPTVVDVGTGAGPIALAVKHERRDARVAGVDLSPDALGYARANASALGLDVAWIVADLLAAVGGPIDLVVSNPPYVAAGDAGLLGADVAAEPSLAVLAGPTGDEVLTRLIAAASQVLSAGGSIVLEVGTEPQSRRIASALRGWRTHGVRADLTGRARVVWATS